MQFIREMRIVLYVCCTELFIINSTKFIINIYDALSDLQFGLWRGSRRKYNIGCSARIMHKILSCRVFQLLKLRMGLVCMTFPDYCGCRTRDTINGTQERHTAPGVLVCFSCFRFVCATIVIIFLSSIARPPTGRVSTLHGAEKLAKIIICQTSLLELYYARGLFNLPFIFYVHCFTERFLGPLQVFSRSCCKTLKDNHHHHI